jgi:hypothetical protein
LIAKQKYIHICELKIQTKKVNRCVTTFFSCKKVAAADVKKSKKITSRSWEEPTIITSRSAGTFYFQNPRCRKRDPRCRKRKNNTSTVAIILDVKKIKKHMPTPKTY